MRTLFFGATDLGYQCCERLLERGEEIVGLFTIPREFRISYSPNTPVKNVLYRDFHDLGARYKVPVVEVKGKMDEYVSRVEEFRPDLILVIGWYYMIPRRMRSLASKGCVGVHGSLLPRYRGGAPLVWAMINGEDHTGVTLFHFADGVDDGDIIGQRKFAIAPDDTIREVVDKATRATIDVVEEYFPRLADGTAPRIAQDHSQATVVPQRSPADGLIDWSWDADRINNFIRAQTKPYPGAFTYIGDKRVTIWSAEVATRLADKSSTIEREVQSSKGP
ncbi:MAG TPA: methionyl-tRNA formyltransferase [Gemmatimonadaceae bacterium]|nr:methionyl-tRNA formyltransferase [Gemmatimonadaceae bacterium]